MADPGNQWQCGPPGPSKFDAFVRIAKDSNGPPDVGFCLLTPIPENNASGMVPGKLPFLPLAV